uniref:Fructokinase n=1 Tax=Rhizophora mucronata TaxID=61149 RepID=A0A2P2J3M2_RHIMU
MTKDTSAKQKKEAELKISVSTFHHALASPRSFRTASLVGSAGIAPLSITVAAPQAFAKRRASLNRFSSLSRSKSEARLLRSPPTKASPAPVVSTGFTFTPATLPLNSFV